MLHGRESTIASEYGWCPIVDSLLYLWSTIMWIIIIYMNTVCTYYTNYSGMYLILKSIHAKEVQEVVHCTCSLDVFTCL